MTETKMLSRRLTDEIKEISNKTEQKNKEKTGGGDPISRLISKQ